MSENKVFDRIFGSEKDDVSEQFRYYITRKFVVNSMLGWACSWNRETRIACRMLRREPLWKRPFGRQRRR
jgi:hypothetical protein